MPREYSKMEEYPSAKFRLVPSLMRGGVPVTRKEEGQAEKTIIAKFESRKFAALDLLWKKDLEGMRC